MIIDEIGGGMGNKLCPVSNDALDSKPDRVGEEEGGEGSGIEYCNVGFEMIDNGFAHCKYKIK